MQHVSKCDFSVSMASKYGFLDSESDSSDSESIVGSTGGRPKRRKMVPHRFRQEPLKEVMEEAALEEKFRE